MPWIDLHCDTFFELMRRNDGESLRDNSLSVNIEMLRQAESIAQFFAVFIHAQDFEKTDVNGGKLSGDIAWSDAYQYACRVLQYAKDEIAANADEIALAGNWADIHNNMSSGRTSAVLTIEEGGILDGKLERIGELYQEGVRLITLTWNHENCLGFPNSREEKIMMQGLKPFGFEVLSEMNRQGMIIDVSHLSDGGFWDVVKHSKAPIVASHSNARALCPHPRNLSDEMIRVLAGKGGIAGVNFYPYFLNGTAQAGVEDLLRHIEHMYQVGGEDFIALGTDFDGFCDGVNEVGSVAQLTMLSDAMRKRGFSERQLEKFCYGNAERVIREVL